MGIFDRNRSGLTTPMSGSSSGGGGSGTVTSVALSVPSILSVAGSPITTSGTLAVTLATQGAHLIFAGPAVGTAIPTFRALGAGDLVVGGTAGQLLQNNGVGIPMTWVTRPTLALDNLASVAINTSLLPGTTNTIDLGSTAKAWNRAYVSSSIRSTIASGYIDMSGMSLYDNPGVVSLNWNSRLLVDASGGQALAWSDGYLNATNGIRLNGSTSGAITHQAAAVTTDYTVIWPSAQGAASTFLQNDGAGNLSWASGSGGATVALDNLVATAINADLVFGLTVIGLLKTADDTSLTQDMRVRSGDGTGGDTTTGVLSLSSGTATGTGNSGSVLITSGDTVAASSGIIALTTGAPGVNQNSGSAIIQTGDTSGSGNAGNISLSGGGTVDGTGGSIFLTTGAATGSGTSGDIGLNAGLGKIKLSSDLVFLTSGFLVTQDTVGVASDGLTIRSGTTDTTITGTVQILSGSPFAADVPSGAINIGSGNSTGTGNSGNLFFSAGQVEDGVSGTVTLSSGAATVNGTSGPLNLITGDTSGTGNSGTVNIASGGAPSASSGVVNITSGSSGLVSGNVVISTGLSLGVLTGDLIAISGSNQSGGSSGAFTVGTGPISDSSGESGTVILSSGTTFDGNSGTVSVGSGSTSGAGASGALTLSSGASSAGISGIVSLKSGNADATTGDVQVTSGNSATDASGNIILQIGTAGTTRGTLQFVDGSEGSANRVWISSNTTGAGKWDASGVSGTFTTVDLQTVTVVNGLITSIV